MGSRLDKPVPHKRVSISANGGAVNTEWQQFFQNLKDRVDNLEIQLTGNASNTDEVTPSIFEGEIGIMAPWPVDGAAPTGWLICDGSAISRSMYMELFSRIGETWGAGDGVTTFNIPDGRGRFFLGADGSTYNVGDTGGSASASLAHNHNLAGGTSTAATGSAGAHTHTVTVTGENAETAVTPVTVGADGTYTTSSDGAHTHTLSGHTDDALGNTSIVPPFFAGNWIIKYA